MSTSLILYLIAVVSLTASLVNITVASDLVVFRKIKNWQRLNCLCKTFALKGTAETKSVLLVFQYKCAYSEIILLLFRVLFYVGGQVNTTFFVFFAKHISSFRSFGINLPFFSL